MDFLSILELTSITLILFVMGILVTAFALHELVGSSKASSFLAYSVKMTYSMVVFTVMMWLVFLSMGILSHLV